ncbi:MAG: hypothetical protein KBF94_12480 [Ilumatobacteraceae bacterium]|nr:hypothetical protein [Ilumatobacteraceae bacterium]
MTSIGRRRFLTGLGAGLVGFTGVLAAGCASGDGRGVSAPTGPSVAGVLDGFSLQVRRDPG